MNKFLWLTCLTIKVCYMESDFGCCDILDGICTECCENFYSLNGICQVCPLGFHGPRCIKDCVYPWYGKLCISRCNCSKDNCHSALGCQIYDRDTNGTSTFNVISSTRYAYQISSLVTTSKTSQETVTMSVKNTYQSAITTEKAEPHSEHDHQRFFVVILLGVTLGVAVLVIMGLICLFLYKKRQRELMNIQQHQFYW